MAEQLREIATTLKAGGEAPVRPPACSQRFRVEIVFSGQFIGDYEYFANNRRSVREVTNRGGGGWQADADGEYRYFYDDKWRILEVRNGSGQVKQQWVYGTQYVDEIILMDNNGPRDSDDDCDPDVNASEFAIPGDQRYFYHQDRNWNVVALSTITDTSQYVNGDIVERYEYTPYGQPTVIAVTAPSSAAAGAGNVRGASLAANIFLHQGLPLDREKDSYQNRWRERSRIISRFTTTDPLGMRDGLNLYQVYGNKPTHQNDPSGLLTLQSFCWVERYCAPCGGAANPTRCCTVSATGCTPPWFPGPGGPLVGPPPAGPVPPAVLPAFGTPSSLPCPSALCAGVAPGSRVRITTTQPSAPPTWWPPSIPWPTIGVGGATCQTATF